MLIKPTPPSGEIPVSISNNTTRSDAPEINIGLVANMFVRQMCFKDAGDYEQGHMHNYDHLTLLATGRLLVEIEEYSTIYTAPHMIYIKKDLNHKLTALEPNTVAYCIHGLRDVNISDDIISPEMIPNSSEAQRLRKMVLKTQ